jgi:ribosomal protein S18 acetylase RimI-like enzyme
VIDIRLANPSDAKALSEMNYEFNKVRMKPDTLCLKLLKGREIVALALVGGVAVGFACGQVYDSICYPKAHAEITELFVKATSRRSGVATSLIAFMEKQLARRKVTHIHILTGSRNKPAQGLYRKLGYKHNRSRLELLYEKDIA